MFLLFDYLKNTVILIFYDKTSFFNLRKMNLFSDYFLIMKVIDF